MPDNDGEKMAVRLVQVFTFTLLLAITSYGQSTAPSEPVPPSPAASNSIASGEEDSGSFGVGVKALSLGGGFEVAAHVSHRTNVRAGFNIFSYGRTFYKDGVAYN